MSATTRTFEDALLAVDAFPPFALAVDVGGSRGSLLRRLLERNPDARGVLFDLAEVIERGRAPGRPRRPADRGGGDFFEQVPAGGDLYVLKFILHDWDDDRAVAILRHVGEAMAPGGRIAIVETVLPDTPVEHPGGCSTSTCSRSPAAASAPGTRSRRSSTARAAAWTASRPLASPLSVILAAPAGTG